MSFLPTCAASGDRDGHLRDPCAGPAHPDRRRELCRLLRGPEEA